MRISEKRYNREKMETYQRAFTLGEESGKRAAKKEMEQTMPNRAKEANLRMIEALAQALDAVSHAVAEIGRV